jgi:ABC-2 type transport system permease protein
MAGFSLSNIFRLGLKELRSLAADKVLLGLIVWAFSGAIYEAATGSSQQLHNAPVAIVDEDHSPLSARLAGALYPPYFRRPELIGFEQVDEAMNRNLYSFVLVIPSHFQRDMSAGRQPAVQLNIDATVISQAFIGASYINNIASGTVGEFLTGRLPAPASTQTLPASGSAGSWRQSTTSPC